MDRPLLIVESNEEDIAIYGPDHNAARLKHIQLEASPKVTRR